MSKVNQLTHWTIIYSTVYSHLSITRNKENRHTDAFVQYSGLLAYIDFFKGDIPLGDAFFMQPFSRSS